MDKRAFFSSIRAALFEGGLKPGQVYNVETLLNAMDKADWPLTHAAYAMATAFHESARFTTMKEMGGTAYFHRMYDMAGDRPKVAATLGNTQSGDGARFFGRGFVQLTGRTNYRKAGRHVGVDLEKDPDRAAEPTTAARILVWGMETGAYTGKANRDYLAKSPPDYVGARRIINGTDKASLIAGYAKLFQTALVGAGYGKAGAEPAKPVPAGGVIYPPAAPAAPVPEVVIPKTPEAKDRPSLWASLISLAASLWKGR